MHYPEKILKLLLGLMTLFLLVYAEQAHAFGRVPILELTLKGNYSERVSDYKKNYTKSWGVELRLPLSNFFELSLGHNFTEDRDVFNEDYRSLQEAQGNTLPEGKIESTDTYIDTTANAAIFYTFGYVRPSILGGALWRTYCSENTFVDYGCSEQDVTWNAGAALSMIVTYNLRLRLTYTFSPSFVSDESSEKYDQSTSLGLTFVL